MEMKWMNALLCHQVPSEFVREQIKNGEAPEFTEYDLTLFDQNAILSSRRRLNTADRLIWSLLFLTGSLSKKETIDFLMSIECHDWLIKEVEARHENGQSKTKNSSY